jgi:hypothetical protein
MCEDAANGMDYLENKIVYTGELSPLLKLV